MKNKMLFVTMLGMLAFLALNVRVGYAGPGAALPATTYEITWYTVDGGGAQNLTGGTYVLNGTAGQFDAGSQGGGTYALSGGFWHAVGVVSANFHLYLPAILRGQ